MYCPPNSQFEFSEKVRLVGCGMFDGAMLPTTASSGTAPAPAPAIRPAWSSVRRDIRRLAFAPSSRAVARSATAGIVALPDAGRGGAVTGPGAAASVLGAAASEGGGAPSGGGGGLPGLPWRGGAPAGAAVASSAGPADAVPAGPDGSPAGGVVPSRAGAAGPEPCGPPPTCGRADVLAACGPADVPPSCGPPDVSPVSAGRAGGVAGAEGGVWLFRAGRLGEPPLPARGPPPP